MKYSEIILETHGFDLFIEQAFDLYNALNRSTNRQYVVAAGRRMLGALKNYKPSDDIEEINIETAIELFQELVRKSGGAP